MAKKKKQSCCKLITANGKDLTEPVEIAYHFNDYFLTVAENLIQKISKTNANPLSFLGPNLSDSFYFYPTTPQEIQTIISSIQNKYSAVVDGIPSFLIKLLPSNIVVILTNIFNLSISTGTFISSFKKSKVIPILKKETPSWLKIIVP